MNSERVDKLRAGIAAWEKWAQAKLPKVKVSRRGATPGLTGSAVELWWMKGTKGFELLAGPEGLPAVPWGALTVPRIVTVAALLPALEQDILDYGKELDQAIEHGIEAVTALLEKR